MIVTIDGGVASGKSAVGRRVGEKLGLPFIDSGLMYRAITRLAADLRAAASQEPDDFRRALHAASLAYLRFAEREPALLDLMLAAKVDSSSEAVRRAAETEEYVIEPFVAGSEAMRQTIARLPA